MRCPKCDAEMTTMTHRGITVDRCNQCHGIWLDRNEFDLLLGRGLAKSFDLGRFSPLSPELDRTPAVCRRCGVEMVSLVGPADVRFEWCEACDGMFFDRGELTIIADFDADE